jgi:DNA-binding NtrC family response regulator
MTSRRALEEVLIGDSPVMQELRSSIRRYAPSPLPVLILGPRGAGKELVAQALHEESGRPGALVAFNTCAIADSMFEDALFGHRRGAFTGATSDTNGYLVEADRGTVFFDEVSGINETNQRKLLRAVETRRFRPIGARMDRTSDFRLVTATNDDVFAMVREGRFRADLADRLGVLIMQIPSLRRRMSDVPALAAHFLALAGGHGPHQFTPAALATLVAHEWPGNVRELRHTVERAVLLSGDGLLDRRDMLQALAPHGASDGEAKTSFKRRRMIDIMDRAEWDVDRAATLLAVDRTTVYRRLKRLGIVRADTASASSIVRATTPPDRPLAPPSTSQTF